MTTFLNPKANWLKAGMVDPNCKTIFAKKAKPTYINTNLCKAEKLSTSFGQFFFTTKYSFTAPMVCAIVPKIIAMNIQSGILIQRTDSPKPITQPTNIIQKIILLSFSDISAPISFSE